MRVSQLLQSVCGRACNQQQHRLARRRVQPMLGRLAYEIGAKLVRNNQPRIIRKNMTWHVGSGCKEQPIAVHSIVLPFLIGAEIGDR